ncbi:hypothetical protein VitviT2T_026042 [Vitis vinifera]|nr:nuclear transport factor 2 isoform X2 [Vitis vinifera]WKA08309.1 hypothetical protein VitviT2T_026042 [Vitis vinifera]|eukprot:XP_010663448.1 PREDICTED: putative G3BP-like protein isoform X2 [Vitis vinifera]
MAMQEATPAPLHSAAFVGNAFVDQYYPILHQNPELLYKFYQDSSVLSRPDSSGSMTTVTTLQAINDKIMSFHYGEYKMEIETADAQDSYKEGVTVLVTGSVTLKDNVKRKFGQSFFLAPQDNGYFVLNDIFTYIEEKKSLQENFAPVDGINETAPTAALTPDPEANHVPDHLVVDPATPSFEEEEDLNNVAEVCDPSDNEEGSVIEEEAVVEPPSISSENEISTVVDSAPAAQEDAPKKSYASIVKVMKGSATSTPVFATSTVRAAPANIDQQLAGSAKSAPAPEAWTPTSDSAPESSNINEEGFSIYVRHLPLSATVPQLEEEFKKFGPIKQDGIQVRSNKQGFCFGFVEFESLSSMQSALEASPITIGDRQAVVEEKRTTTRVGASGRGRYPPGRGGFRNDNFRGRGNFGGGRGYGRNESRNQGEYSGRARGPTGRNGEAYQRVNQNGSGKTGRQGGMAWNSASS